MVKLFDRIVLTSIRYDRFLTLLSIIGVALGIGLFLGVNIAANRAVASFEANIAGIDPAFNYEVVNASGIDFDDKFYRAVALHAAKSLPVLSTNAFLPGLQVTVAVHGIYTVKAETLFRQITGRAPHLESFLTRLDGILVTRRFSTAHNLRQGDLISALVYNRAYRLAVVGVIDTDTVPENTFFMDLGNFQETFGKVGELSRIDVIVDENQAESIRGLLPAGLSLERKEKLVRDRASLIDAFQFNLRFVTFLAVLVGVFLLYNTVFMSVAKRRTEIGILRGLGMDRKTLAALFSAQGVLIGFFGSVLGLAFGQLGAWFSTAMVEKTVSRFYGQGGIVGTAMTPGDAVRTLMFGLVLAFLASLVPALEFSRVSPRESSRPGTFEEARKSRQNLFPGLGFVLIGCAFLLAVVDYRYSPFSFPWPSYAGILLFILGCALSAPSYLAAALALLKLPLSLLFPWTGRITVGDLNGSRSRFSLALMSVAVSSALIVAIVSSVHSLKSSFIDWINTYLQADVYIKPASCTSNFCFYALPQEAVRTVERLPGVATVARFRSLQIDFRGSKVVAGFGNSDLLWRTRPNISREEKKRLQRLAEYPEVLVSDYLAVRYKLKRGDVINVPTPKGAVRFTINGTSISYSTLSGFLYFDRRWLREYWGLDDVTQVSVYLAKGENVAGFIRAAKKVLEPAYAFEITDNRELRESVLAVFDRSFLVTYTIELIAIVISLIGVVNALFILILEKKRDISVLRYLGAGWPDIRGVIVLSAAVIGLAGIALGFLMGTGIGIVITHVINRISFGWEVAFRIPVLRISLLMTLLFITTLAAGLVPGALVRKIDPKAFISFE